MSFMNEPHHIEQFELANEAKTLELGAKLAQFIPGTFVIKLYGQLGAGKTTLVRSIIKSMGYQGAVKSPTYGFIETYEIDGREIFHFDLYRLNSSEELEQIGVRDYFGHAICLIEWAEKGDEVLPTADLDCYISVLDHGRNVKLVSHSVAGDEVLAHLNKT